MTFTDCNWLRLYICILIAHNLCEDSARIKKSSCMSNTSPLCGLDSDIQKSLFIGNRPPQDNSYVIGKFTLLTVGGSWFETKSKKIVMLQKRLHWLKSKTPCHIYLYDKNMTIWCSIAMIWTIPTTTIYIYYFYF